MIKGEKLYEGKAKIVYETDNESLVVQEFKNEATAFDGKKKGIITGKGSANTQISAVLFSLLEASGIPTHFKELLSENEMLILKLQMIPLEVVVRNIAAGSLSKRIGYKEGVSLKNPIVEFYYKDDKLGDPLLTRAHIDELEILKSGQYEELRIMALKVNEVLKKYFGDRDLDLVDFKLEFGLKGNQIIVGDEISPDTCRLWDRGTKEKLDKDRFRRDLGNIEGAYREVLRRVKE
ncbi:MAG: phosphoribosylaminoimidazolesuccinocarboxamide synthase [Actinobacteria bacterium]|nr:phosphoribosylaminoimidazolesuccinocarboxamide synthase [Actinomycetota bacterium]